MVFFVSAGAPVTLTLTVAHFELSATEHAVIVVEPFFKPSTVPSITEATAESALLHLTARGTPSVAPCASFTVAVKSMATL